MWDEYILASTSTREYARIDTREYFYSNEYEYSLRASICIPYGYADLKYMIYAIYMIDLGH